MKLSLIIICFILSHVWLLSTEAFAQVPGQSSSPAPPPAVVNTISTTPTKNLKSDNTNQDTKAQDEKPGRYEEFQSICRKNEYDLPSTLTDLQKEKRITDLKNKINKQPTQVSFKFQLLKEYLDQKDKQGAEKYVEELKGSDLSLTEKSIATQSLALFEKTKSNAEKELVQIISDNPKNAEALKMLAEIYKSQDKYSDATSIYVDLAKITKMKYDEQLCEMYVLDSYFKDAEHFCTGAIKLNPKNPFPYIFLGILTRESKNEKTAADLFKESIKHGKTEIAYVCLGELSVIKKDYKTAAELYKQAQQIKPMSIRAVLGQAWAELYADKFIEALSSFKTACAKDKKFLPEFRKAAKYLSEKKSPYTSQFITESQKCAEM